MKCRYKVFNKDLTSPIFNFQYKIGEVYHCDDFDLDPIRSRSNGIYATGIEGILFLFNRDRVVYEVDVWGKEVEINSFYMRYENIRLVKEINHKELRRLTDKEKLKYNLSEAIFPINTLLVKRNRRITEEEIDWLKDWKTDAWLSKKKKLVKNGV